MLFLYIVITYFHILILKLPCYNLLPKRCFGVLAFITIGPLQCLDGILLAAAKFCLILHGGDTRMFWLTRSSGLTWSFFLSCLVRKPKSLNLCWQRDSRDFCLRVLVSVYTYFFLVCWLFMLRSTFIAICCVKFASWSWSNRAICDWVVGEYGPRRDT